MRTELSIFNFVITVCCEGLQHSTMAASVTHSNIHRCVTNILQLLVCEGASLWHDYNERIKKVSFVCYINSFKKNVYMCVALSNKFFFIDTWTKRNWKPFTRYDAWVRREQEQLQSKTSLHSKFGAIYHPTFFPKGVGS